MAPHCVNTNLSICIMNKLDSLKTVLEAAESWQVFHARDYSSTIKKLLEEIEEWAAAKERGDFLNELEELSDIVVMGVRVFARATPQEQEFFARVVKMKTNRRLGPNGIKDKVAEKEEMRSIAAELGLI